MAIIMYRGKNGELYPLVDSINVSGSDISSVYVGDEEPVDPECKVWYDTSFPTPIGKIYLNGEWVEVAGGGGGGGSTNLNGITITPKWFGKTLSYGDNCDVEISWSSYYGGNPTGMIDYELLVKTPEGEERKEYERIVPEGTRTINLTNYLSLGSTEIILRVTNDRGKFAQAVLTVTTVKLEMKETFDEDRVYTSNIKYYCTPNGVKGKEQKLYVELDGELVIDGQNILENNQLQPCDLSEYVNEHGTHSIRAWFTCQLEEGKEPVDSPKVYSEFVYAVSGNTTPGIVANCGVDKLEEYDSVTFDWYVFSPNSDGTIAEYTPVVEIYHSRQPEIMDGEKPILTAENVERGIKQEHTFKAEYPGDNYIIFKVGDYTRPIPIEVTKSPVDVSAVETNLLLNLSPKYHQNKDPNREKWVSETSEGTITATLENFNFTSDGWLSSGKSTVLRVRDDARVNVPVEIFTEEVNQTGMVIEFELATHDVLDYETTIIECMNSGIGIEVKANQAMLKTKNNTLITPFREGEQVRVTFVIEGSDSPTKLLLIYINGVMSGAKQYTSTDNFAQSVVKGIKIGSNLCATDIYSIRVYRTALGRRDILTNWIADTQDRELLLERYKRNNVFYNNELHPEYLPEGLAYMVFYTNEAGLPQAKGKGEERYLNGKFVDAGRLFTFIGAMLKVQGTSSSGYPIKNFTIIFDEAGGITFTGIRDGVEYADEKFYDFKMFDNSMPVGSFCFKADYASSEGANNVELVKLFNDMCPVKTPPQEEDDRVRQGIDGFPMVIFCYYDNAYYFIGKYNFNNDKSTPEVYGMTEGVQSWEITNNSTAIGEYKEDDFDTIIYKEETDPTTGQTIIKESEKWLDTFEARYPEDNEGYSELQRMVSWVRSTWRAEADDNRKLEKPVTYGKDTYEYDSVDYRKAKFINEVGDYFDVDHLCFFYLFTSFFLMIDNREKNTFPTRYFNKKLNKWLWYFLPYDFDTALGINNSGELVFGHGLEDFDEGIYNGADSVLWCNVRDYLTERIADTYVTLRNGEIFNYDEIVKRFTAHYRAWGEAIFNEDSYVKYIAVMFGENGTADHLGKLQGNKEAQMRHWLYNRFRYFDAKYVTKDAKSEIIIIRPNYIEGGYNNHNIVITPYTDTYCAINFDSMSGDSKTVPKRAFKGETVTFSNPKQRPDNAVVHIYNASQITDLGDLSGQYTSEFVGGSATRLQRLLLGSDSTVNYELNKLTLGNNRLLKFLNVKNCPNLTGDIDISGCSGIEEVYFDGTSVTSVVLPVGGSCRVLHLPETITNLTVLNHKVTDFRMVNKESGETDYSNLSTLWLELNETSKNTFNLKGILNDMVERFKSSEEGELGRLRVTGFELTGDNAFDTAQEVIDLYTDLRTYFRGMDANGVASRDETYLKNMLTGKIEIKEDAIHYSQLNMMQEMFPYVDIEYKDVVAYVYFYVEDKWVHTTVVNIGDNCPDPIGNPIEIPAKAETDTTKFIFKGWDDDLQNVTSDRTVKAEFNGHTKYYVTFMNGDKIHRKVSYISGDTIVSPADAEKESTAQYNFKFLGWSHNGLDVLNDLGKVEEEDITYYAVYENVDRYYPVTFYDEDGVAVLQSTEVKYGVTPTPPTSTKEGYDIVWNEVIVPVTDVTTYTAQYQVKTYTITWILGGNAETTPCDYFTIPSLPEEWRSGTVVIDGVTYNITGVSPEPIVPRNNAIYQVNAEVNYALNLGSVGMEVEVRNKVKVLSDTSFKIYDGEFSTSSHLIRFYIYPDRFIKKGHDIKDMRVRFKCQSNTDNAPRMFRFLYSNSSTIKTEIGYSNYGNKEYQFDKTYTIIDSEHFDATNNRYSFYIYAEDNGNDSSEINFYDFEMQFICSNDDSIRQILYKNYDGEILELYQINKEDDIPQYSGEMPAKPEDVVKKYEFAGWIEVDSGYSDIIIYEANYTAIPQSYLITFVDYNGDELSAESYNYGTSAEEIVKPQCSREHYTFTGWSPELTVVTGDATYTAQYEVKVYEVTQKPTIGSFSSFGSNPEYAYDNDMNSYAHMYRENDYGGSTFNYWGYGFNIDSNAIIKSIKVRAKISSETDYGYAICYYCVGNNKIHQGDLFNGVKVAKQDIDFYLPLEESKLNLVEEFGSDSFVDWLNSTDTEKYFRTKFILGVNGNAFNKHEGDVRLYDLSVTVEYTMV